MQLAITGIYRSTNEVCLDITTIHHRNNNNNNNNCNCNLLSTNITNDDDNVISNNGILAYFQLSNKHLYRYSTHHYHHYHHYHYLQVDVSLLRWHW